MDQPAPVAQIVVDLEAIRANLRRLRDLVDTEVMAVVKADAYGHGMVEVARAAREAGVRWVGVATPGEARALRAAGDTGRLSCWLTGPSERYGDLVAADVDLTAYTPAEVEAISAAAQSVGRTARLQLKFDTGFSRGGAERSLWPALIDAAVKAPAVTVTGLWSHFACADEPAHPANDSQEKAFREALALAGRAGIEPEFRHLANSAGALLRPSARFDMVRFGIATYGLNPAPKALAASDLGLTPAMTVRGRLALAKDIPAGAGVSYGHTFIAPEPMRVGVVAMGYGDGIPRLASRRAELMLNGRRVRLLGTVSMDQIVVEAPGGEIGDEVVLLGPGRAGEPTADDWARWCETINYEIVTRMGGRQVRTYLG